MDSEYNPWNCTPFYSPILSKEQEEFIQQIFDDELNQSSETDPNSNCIFDEIKKPEISTLMERFETESENFLLIESKFNLIEGQISDMQSRLSKLVQSIEKKKLKTQRKAQKVDQNSSPSSSCNKKITNIQSNYQIIQPIQTIVNNQTPQHSIKTQSVHRSTTNQIPQNSIQSNNPIQSNIVNNQTHQHSIKTQSVQTSNTNQIPQNSIQFNNPIQSTIVNHQTPQQFINIQSSATNQIPQQNNQFIQPNISSKNIQQNQPSLSNVTSLPIQHKNNLSIYQTSNNKIPQVIEVTASEEMLNLFQKELASISLFAWSLVYTTPYEKNEDEDHQCILPQKCILEGVTICLSIEKVYFISLKANYNSSLSLEKRLSLVKEIFGNPATRKILFHMKPQLKILFANSILPSGELLDPKICAWILHSDKNKEKTLDELVQDYTRLQPFPLILTDPLKKSIFRTHRSWILMKKLLEHLQKDNRLNKLFFSVEMPLIPILASMEYNGISFVNDTFHRNRTIIKDKLTNLENEAFQLAGKPFSLTSTEQIGKILFEDLNLSLPNVQPSVNDPNKSKKRKQNYSTSATVLEQLIDIHKLPGIILLHRKLSHILKNQMDSLGQFSHFDDRFHCSRIYPIFLQTIVPTGRLACIDPNLHCVVNPVSFITEEGKEVTVSIRDAFIASRQSLLLSADYSQLEVRLMANFSKDELLINILKKDGDVFKLIASEWLEKPVDHITKAEREQAKQICYGILYGQGPKSLSAELKITQEQANQFIKSFKDKYLGVNKFLQSVVEECKKTEIVKTLLGRTRYLPTINSSNPKEKSKAERQAVNTICQGSAADIIKIAMIKICSQLKKMNANTILLLHIHDELLFDVPENEFNQVKHLIKHTMETCVTLDIQLPVKIYAGKTWGTLSEI